MDLNWARIFNRLFELMNLDGETYYSGGRFITTVREIDPYFPDYGQFIEQRRASGKSTSRKDYFYDILMGFPEESRARIVHTILDTIKDTLPQKAAEIRDELGGVAAVPTARLDAAFWNSDRLNRYLQDVDSRISANNYEGAVTLCYTCLEGFLKAFIHQNMPTYSGSTEINDASRAVRAYLKETLQKYPDEAMSMLSHIAHTIDRARNRFSESHFDEEAGRWLAVFMRDLVNSEIRLLLHFMGSKNGE